jgi:hypothetical protein
MSQALDFINIAQRGLSSFNINEHNQQAGMTRVRSTRDWVNSSSSSSSSSSSFGRATTVKRRDVIDKQLRAATKLATELARIQTAGQKSGSVKGGKDNAKCQDLCFVGGWVDEKKNSYS